MTSSIITVSYLILKVLNPSMNDGKVDQGTLDQGMKVLKASLKKLETIFLKDTPFIYSEKMTFSDLLGVAELMQPKMGAGIDVLTGYPKVTQWVERVRSTVGPQLFDESHDIIKRLGEKYLALSKFPTPKL